VQEWAGHSDIRTTMAFYAKVVDSEFEKVSGVTQKVTQKAEKGSEETSEPVSEDLTAVDFTSRAGEGIRTLDVQLGNLHIIGCKNRSNYHNDNVLWLCLGRANSYKVLQV
jgi:hypothetical protein